MTGQTFAVLLSGAALGMTLGAAGQTVMWSPVRWVSRCTPAVIRLEHRDRGQRRLSDRVHLRRRPRRLDGRASAGPHVLHDVHRLHRRLVHHLCIRVAGLMILLDLTFTEAVVAGVVPFILGDIISRGRRPPPPRRLAARGRYPRP